MNTGLKMTILGYLATMFTIGINEMIKVLVLPNDILLEDKENVGPTVLLRGDSTCKHVEFSASVTLRYSDAPKNKTGVVTVHKNEGAEISVVPAEETSYIKLRI